MTATSRALVAAVFVAAALWPRPAAAQEARPESRGLALELVGAYAGGRQIKVPEGASESGFEQLNPPDTIAGWAQPKGRPPLTDVRLRLSYEGDAVRVRVAAVTDDAHLSEAPGPKYGAREHEVANILAREGETFAVGFKRFGAEPFEFRVVRFVPEPELPPPAPAPSRAASRLKSVEVIAFTTAGAHLERGQLTLLNVSSKDIVALELCVTDYGMSQQSQAAPGRALMEPGGTFRTEVSLGRRRLKDEPPPDALVVTAVVFGDGSYEGDAEDAAWMAARQRGRLAQFARVLGLLPGAPDAATRESVATLAALKSRVEGLRIDAEPSLLDELQSQFPGLADEEGRTLLAEAALDGMRAGREESLRIIQEAAAAAGGEPGRQLESVREKVEKRAGRRRD